MTDARTLWPSSAPNDKIDHWGWLAGKLGATTPLARPFLIGIRGVRPNEPETHRLVIRATYDDTFVLLDADGLFAPVMFPGSSHAYQLNSRASPDVNHDGVGDVGTILPGKFVLTECAGKYPVFTVTLPNGDENLPCTRDLRHDGTEQEGPYTADSILVHWGYNAPADSDHKSSIGCQTLDGQWLRLLHDRCAKHGGKADYVLITADNAIEILKDSPFQDLEPTKPINLPMSNS